MSSFKNFHLIFFAVLILAQAAILFGITVLVSRNASLSAEIPSTSSPLASIAPKENGLTVLTPSPPTVTVEATADTAVQGMVGGSGGAWTAETHLRKYGFNVDAGLINAIDESCREVENTRNGPESKWNQHPALFGWWKAPKVVDCKVLELGGGVGVYVDALVKDQARRQRKVFMVEPIAMGGTFLRRGGPKQLAINILDAKDAFVLATKLRMEHLNGEFFDLLYSIEVCEHMPPDRHADVAKFFAGLSHKGTKLIFASAKRGQHGHGHIGGRNVKEWEGILAVEGFSKDTNETLKVKQQLEEYNHKVNTQVYFFHGE